MIRCIGQLVQVAQCDAAGSDALFVDRISSARCPSCAKMERWTLMAAPVARWARGGGAQRLLLVGMDRRARTDLADDAGPHARAGEALRQFADHLCRQLLDVALATQAGCALCT